MIRNDGQACTSHLNDCVSSMKWSKRKQTGKGINRLTRMAGETLDCGHCRVSYSVFSTNTNTKADQDGKKVPNSLGSSNSSVKDREETLATLFGWSRLNPV
jgi:hypothetical protein